MSTSQRPWQLEYLDDELVPSDNSVSQQASESYDRSAALQATSSATALGSIISNQALNISSTEQAPSQPSTSKAARAPVSIKPFQSTGRVGWAKLNKLVDVLGKSTAVCVPLKEIVGDFIGLIDVYERAGDGSEEYETLRNELEYLFEDLSQHLSASSSQTMTTSMKNLCHGIKKELCYVRSKHLKRQKGPEGRRRNLEAGGSSDEVFMCYRRIQGYLQRLTLNANLSLWKIIDEHVMDARLDRLAPVTASFYDSDESLEVKRGPCTEGTRVEVLANMHHWVRTSLPGAVYWLNGMAGTGKTTIAYSLCEALDTAHELGASFFCTRMLPDCRNVNKLVPSIAYQLARFSRPFLCALLRVVETERDIHKRVLRKQFETMIVKPLIEIQDSLPADLVVVIDALDECDNKDSTRQILDLLLTKSWALPIKFFVCSRPEPQIRDEMMLQGGLRASARLVLHELDKGTVQADIGTYLREALRPMQPSEAQITGLAERAGVLFIYAATAVRYVGYDNFRKDPHVRLEAILNISREEESNKHKEIDDLYTMILRAAIDDPGLSKQDKEDMRLVLNTVVCAREPMTIGALAMLLQLQRTERVHSALRPLWSVLHIMEVSEIVTTLHASFPDYMFDSTRSKVYHCSEMLHNGTLAQLCFECIANTQPQFNICGLESSCVPDEEVQNLDERVNQAISTELFYACRYWVAHLEYAPFSFGLVKQLDDFFSRRFLLWMEVLNLKKCIRAGADMVWRAGNWGMSEWYSEGLKQLAHEVWRFVMVFASSPVSQSTPHIYMSMLPFWPPSAPIARCYMARTRSMITPQGTAMTNRRLSVLASWLFDEEVRSAAFSRNGTQIALAAGNKVHLLDAFTGHAMIDPFEGHAEYITAVDFSPDGKHIVSGSRDKTVRIWDPQNGQEVVRPLRGHIDKVTSVKFSPDGTCIVSGSDDGSLRMWDAHSGRQMLLNGFQGHKSGVTSVGFSPDGIHVVSSSVDMTICVWSVQSGRKVHVLEGHTDIVNCAEFSPDGRHVISASHDGTLRLWDVHVGQGSAIGPYKGHTDRVTAAAFSPNGGCVVSGSTDKTIHVLDPTQTYWDTILGPLELHTGTINSVAFSIQGTHIVSTSSDRSVTLWDARSKQATRRLHDRLSGPVHSVAFSPDGNLIASGTDGQAMMVWNPGSEQAVLVASGCSNSLTPVAFSPNSTRVVSGFMYNTIRVWDLESGAQVLGPLKGHTDLVRSVAVSPSGTFIISGSDDHTIRVWDAQSGRSVVEPLQGHTNAVTSVTFSSDSTRIISGSRDKTLRVWEAQSGKSLLGPLRGHTSWVTSVGSSPNGARIVSGSVDKTIRVWDIYSGQNVLGPLEGHADHVTSVAFSPDSTLIVSGSADKTIRVWDVRNGQTVSAIFKGHTECVRSVGFSPDGTRIVSGSDDKTLCVWNARKKVFHTTLRSFQASSSTSSVSTSSSILLWTLREDGWVVDGDSKLLVWVPRDLHDSLAPPGAILQLSSRGSVCLDFDGTLLGNLWAKCYCPI